MAKSERTLEAAVEFGRRLRLARVAIGLSQMALAERCGLHFTYISSVERGQRNVSLETIVRLAQAVSTDPGELVQGLEPTSSMS